MIVSSSGNNLCKEITNNYWTPLATCTIVSSKSLIKTFHNKKPSLYYKNSNSPNIKHNSYKKSNKN